MQTIQERKRLMTSKIVHFNQLSDSNEMICDSCGERSTGQLIRLPFEPKEYGGLDYQTAMKDNRSVLAKKLIKEGWFILNRSQRGFDELCLCPKCVKHIFMAYVREQFGEKGESK
jgi:hypothetical protein